MKILRAQHLGMCFGVRDAIALASAQAARGPLTILGELVHNETVNATLREQGVQIESDLARVHTGTVMITAHGASEKLRSRVVAQGHPLIDATCPLVHFAHRTLTTLVAEGFHPVIIGKRDHVEVRGLTEDLVAFDVVQSEADVNQLLERPRFGIVAQTTHPIARARELVETIRQRFPQSEICFRDTVCQPTKQRQAAAIELAQQCDAVVVIGGAHSNNTRELAATCRLHCEKVFPVQTAEELQQIWFTNCETVGITAGTSTPETIIAEVEQRLLTVAKSARSE